jgi:hypothetical protein
MITTNLYLIGIGQQARQDLPSQRLLTLKSSATANTYPSSQPGDIQTICAAAPTSLFEENPGYSHYGLNE